LRALASDFGVTELRMAGLSDAKTKRR